MKGLLKRDGGIARLADEAWLSVSAPQSYGRVTDQSSAACWLALQGIIKLLRDDKMNTVVKRVLKLGSGVKRLDEDFVKVGCGVRLPIVHDAAGVCMSSCSCCCCSSRRSPST